MTPITQQQLYEDLAHLLSLASKIKVKHITDNNSIDIHNFIPSQTQYSHQNKNSLIKVQELLVKILKRMYIFVYQESLECNSTLDTIIEINAQKLKNRQSNN